MGTSITITTKTNTQDLSPISSWSSMGTQLPHLSYENLSVLLHKCLKSKLSNSKQAKQIHAFLVTSEMIAHSALSLDSKLVGLYASCGDLHYAGLLFDKLPKPNIFALNWMVSAMAFHGHYEKAIGYFSMVQKSGNVPNKYTFSSVLKACVGLVDLSNGKEVHAMTSKMGFGSDVLVSNALIDMYFKCGKITFARNLFDRMPNRDVASWTAMISGCCNVGMLEESITLFERMKWDGIQPNDYTWNAIIAGYARIGDCDQALRLFNRMNTEGLVPNLVTFNALISGFAQGNQAVKAVELFKNMIANGIRPNCVTITGLLPACESLGSIQKVRKIHCLIYRLNLEINVYVAGALIDMYAKCGSILYANSVFQQSCVKNIPMCNALIGCYARHGLVDSAMQLFEQMQRYCLKPNQVTLVCILSACSHGGLVEKGMEIFRSMKEKYGVEANKEHYACVIDLLCRAGKVEDAYEMVIRAKPMEGYESAVGAFLNGCQIHGRKDLAKRVAQNILQMELKRPGGFVTLSNIYAADGEFEEVENVRKLMKLKDVHKRPGFSSLSKKT